MRRVIAEMTLLSKDAPADCTYNGTRYMAMYAVGVTDLYEALQTSAQMFIDFSINRYTTMSDLHTVLLVVTVLLLAGYVLFMVLPYLKRVRMESVRMAGLLSHVPHDLDVKSHVRFVVRRQTNALKGKN